VCIPGAFSNFTYMLEALAEMDIWPDYRTLLAVGQTSAKPPARANLMWPTSAGIAELADAADSKS
jgi:hypothetical protein